MHLPTFSSPSYAGPPPLTRRKRSNAPGGLHQLWFLFIIKCLQRANYCNRFANSNKYIVVINLAKGKQVNFEMATETRSSVIEDVAASNYHNTNTLKTCVFYAEVRLDYRQRCVVFVLEVCAVCRLALQTHPS